MKKLLALLLACSMLSALTGCGKKEEAASAGSVSTETTQNSAAEPLTEYPFETVKVVVPFSSGGNLDIGCRLFCEYWGKYSGINFVVENYSGANGQVGVSQFLSSADDGSYILWSAQPFYSSNIITQGADFSLDDIKVLNFHEREHIVIAVDSSSKYKTFEDLEADILANPGTIRLGVQSGGGAAIMTQLILEQRGWDVKLVNYDGGTALRTAMLGNHIDVMVCLSAVSITNGDTCLVINADERNPLIPDTPTVTEIFGEDFPTTLGTQRFVAIHRSLYEKHPEYFDFLLETMQQAYEDPDYLKAIEANNTKEYISYIGPEASDEMNASIQALVEQYKDVLMSN